MNVSTTFPLGTRSLTELPALHNFMSLNVLQRSFKPHQSSHIKLIVGFPTTSVATSPSANIFHPLQLRA